MDNLLRYNFQQRFVVVDTETEGLNLVGSRPWQISWLVSTGKKIESIHDHFIDWPELKVSPDAARVTGFNMKEYIRRKESPHHVYSLLCKEMDREDTIVVGHNFLKFDCYILNILRRLIGLKPDYDYLRRTIDTNALSFAVKKGLQPPENISLLEWQLKLAHSRERGVKTNLAAMLRHFEIECDPSKLHDAKYDITKNFELLTEIIKVVDV
jgi:DNA polymerase III epsilon subunit-like protein